MDIEFNFIIYFASTTYCTTTTLLKYALPTLVLCLAHNLMYWRDTSDDIVYKKGLDIFVVYVCILILITFAWRHHIYVNDRDKLFIWLINDHT